jgi:hypothetical protein
VIDSVSATVVVFDLTDPSSPVEIVSGTTTTGALTANPNGTGAVAWGTISGNSATLYAMNSNQGIQAFVVSLDPPASAGAYGAGCDGLGLAGNGVPALGNAAFALDVTGVQPISPIAFVGFGTIKLDPGVSLAGLGMPGCFAYQNLDLGLFATGPVAGGVGSFPLVVPNTPSLAGAVLAAQGSAFTLNTVLGLSASNGVEVVFGF